MSEQEINQTSSEVNQPASEGSAPEISKEAKEDVVAYDTHRKLLSQRKADQAKMSDLEQELERYRAQEKQIEQRKLEEKGEYEKILKIKEQEIQELRMQQEENARRDVQAAKLQAFMDTLPGKIRNKQYLAHVNIDDIVVDPETKTVDDYSVKKAVDSFLKDHSSLIEPKEPEKPKLSSRSPQSASISESMTNDDKLKFLLENKG